jgi:hypothetical protein
VTVEAIFAWENENGDVSVTTCVGGVDPQAEAEELTKRGLIPKGAKILFNPALPDRSTRGKWRIKNGRIVVDATVPDPPHPRQALLDSIDSATSLDELKAAMRESLL